MGNPCILILLIKGTELVWIHCIEQAGVRECAEPSIILDLPEHAIDIQSAQLFVRVGIRKYKIHASLIIGSQHRRSA
jgi:hypothetical protein